MSSYTQSHTAISAEQGRSTLTQNSCFSIVVIQTVFVNVTRCLLKFDSKKTNQAPICEAVSEQCSVVVLCNITLSSFTIINIYYIHI